MKTTGIIRRIDELGRIVIPKEIRKNMRIKNGDTLEIFVDEERIILKKYSPIESLEEVAEKYADTFNQVLKHKTDRNKIIAISGHLKKKYLGKNISSFTERSIDRRDSFVERQKKTFEIIEDENEFGYYSFASIVNNGDAIGGVYIVSTDIPIMEADEKMATILANLLSKNFVE